MKKNESCHCCLLSCCVSRCAGAARSWKAVHPGANTEEYELCVSCAHEFWKWFNGEGDDNEQ